MPPTCTMRQSLAAVAAAFSCAAAAAGSALAPDARAMSSADLRAAYLHCDRITSGDRADLDTMSWCAQVGEVLLHRDFQGDFALQLRWWKQAREPAGTPAAPRPASVRAGQL